MCCNRCNCSNNGARNNNNNNYDNCNYGNNNDGINYGNNDNMSVINEGALMKNNSCNNDDLHDQKTRRKNCWWMSVFRQAVLTWHQPVNNPTNGQWQVLLSCRSPRNPACPAAAAASHSQSFAVMAAAFTAMCVYVLLVSFVLTSMLGSSLYCRRGSSDSFNDLRESFVNSDIVRVRVNVEEAGYGELDHDSQKQKQQKQWDIDGMSYNRELDKESWMKAMENDASDELNQQEKQNLIKRRSVEEQQSTALYRSANQSHVKNSTAVITESWISANHSSFNSTNLVSENQISTDNDNQIKGTNVVSESWISANDDQISEYSSNNNNSSKDAGEPRQQRQRDNVETRPRKPAAFTALLVFGDSTVDAGTNNHFVTVSRSNFRPYGRDLRFSGGQPTGRFCNGMLVTDYIASMVGLRSLTVPYLDMKINENEQLHKHVRAVSFASASSGFYHSTAVHFNAIPLGTQLDHFKEYRRELLNTFGEDQTFNILGNAFFIISTGTNDYLNNYLLNPFLRAKYTIPQFEDVLLQLCARFIEDLYKMGARKIGIVSLPPMGCLPAVRTLFRQDTCVEHLNDHAITFNNRLHGIMDTLTTKLSELRLVYMDSYTVLSNVVHNPNYYGFKESRRACCGSGKLEVGLFCNMLTSGTCEDASEFAFWDSFHPTDHMNKILALNLLEQIWDKLGVNQTFTNNPNFEDVDNVIKPSKKQQRLNNKWRLKFLVFGIFLYLFYLLKQFFPMMINVGV